MKFQNFQVESVFVIFRVGIMNLKLWFEMNTEKFSKRLLHETWIFKHVKEKHSIYKKSFCICEEWRMKE